ncbi:MAG: type IV pilus modification protein PilV [Burkholderiaceae bacterium]
MTPGDARPAGRGPQGRAVDDRLTGVGPRAAVPSVSFGVRRRRRAAGFSLIEVLVSMFIVAMGILALAGLLQAASRYGKMGELRSTATLLANDIADRIRANPAGAELGAAGYDLATRAYPSGLVAPHAACTSASPCSPAELAQADMSFWTTRLRAMLPSGSAYIKNHPATGSAREAVDVWVGWTDPNTLPSGVTTERSGTECPADWSGTESSVRCIYLQVGL